MGLNVSKGNMYPWVTHTWNIIKGRCPHSCSYCYMKRFPQPELHFDDKEFATYLGKWNTIFVGSSCDAWAQPIPNEWIELMLDHCQMYPQNKYFFQSKNPLRFGQGFIFPPNTILGVTIETNRHYADISKSSTPGERYSVFIDYSLPKIVSIEPVMDFELDVVVKWMRDIKPLFVSIGADSQAHHLPEPPPEKITDLICALKEFTEVKVKKNLNRLLK